jgi:hypothetical protein
MLYACVQRFDVMFLEKKIVGTKQGLISQLLTFMSCHDISFFAVNEQIAEKHPVLTC